MGEQAAEWIMMIEDRAARRDGDGIEAEPDALSEAELRPERQAGSPLKAF